jgi:uncharacterized spore protein YtfJ
MAQITEALSGVKDVLSVKRVFGEPYEKDGVTIIPVAAFGGGGGGGGDNQGNGGSGFGLGGRPVGAYVIKNGEVSWQPAIDVGRMAYFAVVALLILRGFLPWRSRRRRRRRAKKG